MASEWREVRLEDIAAPSRNALVGGPFGSELVSSDYAPCGVPVIRGENVSLGRWVAGDFAFVSERKARQLAANTAGPLDLVFTQRGANHYRQVALVPAQASDRFVISQSQMKLTVDPRQADPLFIYYLMRAPDQQAYLQRNAIQTGVPHTNLSILRRMPVRIPPLGEQQAIARTLGALDDKIELNRRMSQTLESMARALFKSWFIDFDPFRAKGEGREPLVPPSIADLFSAPLQGSELGEIPVGWRVTQITELAEVVGGNTPPTDKVEFWHGGGHRFATPKDLASLDSPVLLDTEHRITDAGLARVSSGLLPPGTVLLSSRAPIGYRAICEVPVAINQGFVALRPREQIPSLFLYLWLASQADEILSRANGSTFLEISKSSFRGLQLVAPPQPIIAAFGRLTAPIQGRLSSLAQEQVVLASDRDALLPGLITGRVDFK